MMGESTSTSAAAEPETTNAPEASTRPALPPPPTSLPPKIPPPPSEHPPPYTPFGGQAATLLPQPAGGDTARHRRRRLVVHPPGLRKYLQHATKRNLLIAGAVLAGLLLFLFVVYQLLDREQVREPLSGTRPMEATWTGLGAFKSPREKMSFDAHSSHVFLSEYSSAERLLHSEKLNVDDHLAGFSQRSENVSVGAYTECMRFTDEAHCCSTSTHSRHHKTDCYLQHPTEGLVHSVASTYDFVHAWQSLSDDSWLVILRNRQRHAVMDLSTRRIHAIEENRLPHGYLSVGFFFPMDTAQELNELVRSGGHFRVCHYLRTSAGDYALKDDSCEHTRFAVEFELPKVKYCSNPLYTAVVQYGQLKGDQQPDLTWHLRVQYDSSPDVYSASETLESTLDSRHQQLAMDCSDEQLSLFVMGASELHMYTVELPNLRSEHMIQTRRF